MELTSREFWALIHGERLGDRIAAAMPRAAAQGGDLADADGLALMRAPGISKRA